MATVTNGCISDPKVARIQMLFRILGKGGGFLDLGSTIRSGLKGETSKTLKIRR